MKKDTQDTPKTVHPKSIITNLLLFAIVLILFSILWTLNKGLRQFIYHELRTGIMFYNFSWESDHIEEIAVTGDKYLFPCEKTIYVFDVKIATQMNEKIYENGKKAQDVCTTEKNEGQIGYWYPYRNYSTVGLFGEIFKEDKEPTLERGWLVEYLKEIDPSKYDAYMRKVTFIEEAKELKECLKTGSYAYCKGLPPPW